MDTRAKSVTRGPIAPALDPTTSGRDVLSALAAAWSSSNGTPTGGPDVAHVSASSTAGSAAGRPGLPVRFNRVRQIATTADQPPASLRRAGGR